MALNWRLSRSLSFFHIFFVHHVQPRPNEIDRFDLCDRQDECFEILGRVKQPRLERFSWGLPGVKMGMEKSWGISENYRKKHGPLEIDIGHLVCFYTVLVY